MVWRKEHVHGPLPDLLSWNPQIKLKGTDEMEQKGLHPSRKMSCIRSKVDEEDKSTDSITANLNPIQDRVPPRKVNMLPYTP